MPGASKKIITPSCQILDRSLALYVLPVMDALKIHDWIHDWFCKFMTGWLILSAWLIHDLVSQCFHMNDFCLQVCFSLIGAGCQLVSWSLGQSKRRATMLMIDREALKTKTPREQRSRLKALHDAGAHIYLCKGYGPLGAYHRKVVICERRYMVSGGSSFTGKSRSNKELGYRLTGQDVTEVRS